MAIITGDYKKASLRKLRFSGNFNENLKVFGITMGNQTMDFVSFNPCYVLFDRVLREFPNTTVSKDVEEWYQSQCDREAMIMQVLNDNYEIDIVEENNLYYYQEKGVEFLKRSERSVLADDRGLGKTVQAIYAANDCNIRLVICPSYLIPQWAEEVRKWSISEIVTIMGTPEKKIEQMKETQGKEKVFIIASYRTVSLPRYVAHLPKKIDCLIVDEAHRISNRKTAQTKAIQFLSGRIKRVYFLTGSDFHRKSPETVFPMLNCIDPMRFPSYWHFFHMFVEAYQRSGRRGYQIIGPKNSELLAEILASLRLKRTKEEVAPQLPPKIFHEIWVSLTKKHKQLYDEIKANKMIGELNITAGVALFSYLMRLVNNAEDLGFENSEPKVETMANLIEDILAEGQKVLIFGYHKKYLNKLSRTFAELKVNGNVYKSLHIDGDTSILYREEYLKKFRETDEYNMLFATYGTIGEGTNLQECSNVICYELPWNPETLNQAIDRCHRITSKVPVNVYFVLAKGTVDKHIYDVMKGKEEYISEQNNIMKIIQRMKGEESCGNV